MASRPTPAGKSPEKTADTAKTVRATGKGAGGTAARDGKAVAAAGAKSVSQVAVAKAAPTDAPSVASANPKVAAEIPTAGKSSNANAFKKKDLIDRVLAATGAKKKLVKEIVEATLTVLGDALSRGEMLNVPPFGKAKVSRQPENGTRNAMTVKVRRNAGSGQGGAKAKQSLADADL